jgi:hypothetical protein
MKQPPNDDREQNVTGVPHNETMNRPTIPDFSGANPKMSRLEWPWCKALTLFAL